MANQLPEQKVLKKLGIQDFRHLTKSKIINLVSMLDKMNPDVAKKALEQFPQFAQTCKEMLLEYKDTLDKGMSSNDKSIQTVYDTYNTIIVSLQKQLDNENLSFEEKKYIIEQMKEIADKVDKKDTENKRWITGMVALATAAVLGVAMGLASSLGGNAHIELADSDDEDCE